MSACPASAPAVPTLTQLMVLRHELECRLQRLTQKLLEADAYLDRGKTDPSVNVVLGCYTRKVVHDQRLGVIQRLSAVRLELSGWFGG